MRITHHLHCLLGLVLLAGCAATQPAPLTGEAAAFQHDVATLASDAFEGREVGTPGNQCAMLWIVDQFRAAGLQPGFPDRDSYLQPFALSDGRIVNNVVGVLPGDPAAGALIIGAHFDHLGFGGPHSASHEHAIHPGADDNASGSSGLLLLARRYAQRVHDDAAPTQRRTLYFVAFNGEESIMLGSNYMAAHLDELHLQPRDIAAMINMDMIGRLRDDKLYIFGINTAVPGDWPDRIMRAIQQSQSMLQLRLIDSALVASDQKPFAEAGIPALLFFTGKHEDYHRPTDTAKKINAPGAIRVIDVVDALLQGLWKAKGD